MNGPPRAPERVQLDALLYRMLGGLLLLGAAILLALVLVLLQLPRAAIDGVTLLVLPGTAGRHGLAPVAVPALGSGALVLGLAGLASLTLARKAAPFRPMAPQRSRSFRRPALILLAGVALLAAVLFRR